MPNALKIKKTDPNIPSWWQFEALREKGLEYIASFSGELWTDHNLHDPGVTILEILCYAISDLGYRASLDIEDLLALGKEETETNLFSAEEILTVNPLTITDYRKMLIDIAGVRNAWLVKANEQEVALYVNCDLQELSYSEKSQGFAKAGNLLSSANETITLNGLYKVYLDIDPVLVSTSAEDCNSSANSIDAILQMVQNRLQKHRNLCEDFLEITVLQDEEIGICSEVELDSDADPDIVLAGIYEALETFLSPRINFYSLKEMVEQGKSLEEIFEGRPYTPAFSNEDEKYSHGFINTEELNQAEFPERLLASDLYRVLMDVEGVRAIKGLAMNKFKDGRELLPDEEWVLKLTPGHRPIFSATRSLFKFTKGALLLTANTELVQSRFQKRLLNFLKNKYDPTELNSSIPYGTRREDLDEYISIQHEFPIVYGIGNGDLSEDASEERKVQALQLQGYLTFFDQILAGYLSQLANVRELFSWKINDDEKKTSFQQALNDIPNGNKILLSQAEARLEKCDEEDEDDIFIEGEVLALPPQNFKHPIERDMAIDQIIEFFKNTSNEPGNTCTTGNNTNNEVNTIEIKQEDSGGFRFFINGPNNSTILQSKSTYTCEEKAGKAADVLFFLGTQSKTYEHINWPELSEYGFRFVYNPVNYVDYLSDINESEADFYARKDKLLNHLLARFGEEFSQYVLLMYALNQGAPDPRTIVEDKARFLEEYPDISRNRGRGFDYTDKGNIWDSGENITGLEKRVSGLMGIKGQRRTLGNFEVILRDQEYVLQIKDHRGTLLFESENAYPEADRDAALEDFACMLCNPDAYETFVCDGAGVYGFRLRSDDGKIFARYVRTFGTAEQRDCMMALTQNFLSPNAWVSGEPQAPITCEPGEVVDTFTGLAINILPEDEGFRFLLKMPGKKEALLKSSKAYATEVEASAAWELFLELMFTGNILTESTKGRFNGGIYSYALFTKDEEGKKLEEIAFHPKGYKQPATRNKKKNTLLDLLGNNKLKHKISQLPSLYSWYLSDDGQGIIESVHRFKTNDHAIAAWEHFKRTAANRENYKKDTTDTGGFIFYIAKQDLVLARSEVFANEQDRDEAIDKTFAKIQSGNRLMAMARLHAGKFFFSVLNAEGEKLLNGIQHFDSAAEAAMACFQLLRKAGNQQFYKEIAEPGGERFSFEVGDKDTSWARHPGFYSQTEKDHIQQDTILFVSENTLPFSVEKMPGYYYYEISWENCLGECEVLLREKDPVSPDVEAAINAAHELLDGLRDKLCDEQCEQDCEDRCDPIYTIKTLDNRIVICDADGIVYAHSWEPFESELALTNAVNDARDYLSHHLNLYPQNDDGTPYTGAVGKNKLLDTTSRWKACNVTCSQDDSSETCIYSSFVLAKTEMPMAYHPEAYTDIEQRNEMLNQLLLKVKCGVLSHTDMCLQGSRITFKVGNKFHFELWKTNKVELLWRSAETYNSQDDAEKAFYENWLNIIRLSTNGSNYKMPGEETDFLSLWDGDQQVAFLPVLPDGVDASQAKDFLRKVASLVPFYKTNEGYRFRLYDETGNNILWESSQTYEQLWESEPDEAQNAWQAFNSFRELLNHGINYRSVNNQDTCLYKIDLVETLLESEISFADVFEISTVARYWKSFDSKEEAAAAIPTVFQDIQYLSEVEDFEDYIDTDDNQKYFFGVEVTGDEPDQDASQQYTWQQEGSFFTEGEAYAVLRTFIEHLPFFYKYVILETSPGVFNIAMQHLKAKETSVREQYEPGTIYALCPTVYNNTELAIGEHTVYVANDCSTFDNDQCIQPVSPAAWDVGLQNFLTEAIYPENYYPFIDYHNECKYSFRVVSGNYRVARNPREFALPAHQAKFKDWLYGYSRCNEAPAENLPVAGTYLNSGVHHYFLAGKKDFLSWCRDSSQNFNDSLEIFCLARNPENYKKTLEGSKYIIEIVDNQNLSTFDKPWLAIEGNKYFNTEADADAAIAYSALYAQTMLESIINDPAKRPPVTEINSWDCMNLPELLWRSKDGYGREFLAEQAFSEKIYEIYYYAQELDFYELGKEFPDSPGRPIHLIDDNNAVIMVSFQNYANEDEWNPAVLNRILAARKFPYYKFDGKFGFQYFSFENPPVYELRPRTDCDPALPEVETPESLDCIIDTSNIIDVQIPGDVIWESIQEYNSIESAQCAYSSFRSLLNNKDNYQSIGLSDCNLFGLELTHPGEVLANHPQGYRSQTALQNAIQRAQGCINVEGMHLVEHILLRPKRGTADHVTIQFKIPDLLCDGTYDTENPEDPDYVPMMVPKRLLSKVYTDEGAGQSDLDILFIYLSTNLPLAGEEVSDETVTAVIEDMKVSENPLFGRIAGNFVQENMSEFVKEIRLATEEQGVPASAAQWDTLLREFIFLFNKSGTAPADQLIPGVCPDCDNIEFLPDENPSAAACQNPKALLNSDCDGDTDSDDPTPSSLSGKYYIPGADPYSFWSTIVMPYWPRRFQNANFRNFFEDTLRQEAPAHVGLRICWLSPEDMRAFERAYRDWLEAFGETGNCNLQDAKNRLLYILFDTEGGISNVYPPARLQDIACDQTSNDPNAVLLDFTQLS